MKQLLITDRVLQAATELERLRRKPIPGAHYALVQIGLFLSLRQKKRVRVTREIGHAHAAPF